MEGCQNHVPYLVAGIIDPIVLHILYKNRVGSLGLRAWVLGHRLWGKVYRAALTTIYAVFRG